MHVILKINNIYVFLPNQKKRSKTCYGSVFPSTDLERQSHFFYYYNYFNCVFLFLKDKISTSINKTKEKYIIQGIQEVLSINIS